MRLQRSGRRDVRRSRNGLFVSRNPFSQCAVKTGVIKWLANVVAHAGFGADSALVFHGVRRHPDHRQRGEARPAANGTGGGETVHDRHLDIHQNNIKGSRPRFAQNVECFLSIGRHPGRDSHCRHQRFDDLTIHRLIFYNQHVNIAVSDGEYFFDDRVADG